MKTEVSRYLPGGNPPKRRFRKPFPLGAPQALIAPLEGILEAARALSGALRASAFTVEGREITLVATRGGEPGAEPPPSRIAARALATGSVLTEEVNGTWIRAIPIAEEPAPGSERRRLKPRSTLTSACLVLEGGAALAAENELPPAIVPVSRAILAALDARSFADAVATDGSTGALSRPAFERAATNELAIATSAERPAALVLLEVLPRNPGVRVEAAEEALAAAAGALRAGLRANDLVGRRGPDELAALLVDADPASVPATAERLLRRVARALEPLGMEAPVLGASAFPGHGESFEALDAAALDALESARSAGSGAFKVYDPELGRSPTACRRSFFTGDPGLDARKAALLFESVLAANGAREIREALDAVLRALLAATGADRVAVLSGDGQKLEVAAARDHDWEPLEGPLRFSRSACLRALALGRAICVTDTNEAHVPLGSSAQDLHLRSIVVVLFLGREGALGALYADSLRPALRTYGAEELAYLEALAAQAALAIENAGLRERLEEENAALRRAARKASTDAPVLLGTSEVFRKSLEHLPEIVEGSSSVLILGESGTGKELLARAIHELGPRARGSFIAQNCAAIPAELLESELFGHAAGAFSGAAKSKRGLIELAAQGTFFLDEVGDLPLGLQAKLLRVLEDKEVRRIGETRGSRVDFRLICATNRDLRHEVEEGRFRRDLYYRMNVFTVTLPPLRDRSSDVPELTRHFVARAAQRLGRPQPEVSAEALLLLERCPWPGNVRELANVLEKATALARDGRIEPAHLGLEAPTECVPLSGALRERLAALERDLVADALRAHDGNVSAAARVLGIARQQLQRLMRKYPGSVLPGPETARAGEARRSAGARNRDGRPRMDNLLLSLYLEELAPVLEGARVEKALQYGPSDLALRVWLRPGRESLMLSADPAAPVLALVEEEPPEVRERSPMLEAVRSRVVPGTLTRIERLPLDRVVVLHVASSEGERRLVLELVPRMPALFLLDAASRIIAALGPGVPGKRGLRPGGTWQPPLPPPAGAGPLAGLSRRVAREIEARAAEAGHVPLAEARVAFEEEARTHPRPTLHRLADGSVYPAPLPFVTLASDTKAGGATAADETPADERAGDETTSDQAPADATAPDETAEEAPSDHTLAAPTTLRALVAQAYREGVAGAREEGLRARLRAAVGRRLERTAKTRGRVAAEAAKASELETDRERGELLLAFQSVAVRSGDSSAETARVPDPAGDGTMDAATLAIPLLAPGETLVANANAYFERYHARKRTLAATARRAEELRLEEEHLAELDVALETALPGELPSIAEELRADGLLDAGQAAPVRPAGGKARRGNGDRARSTPAALVPREHRAAKGSVILVGRSSRGNDRLTFVLARDEDFWLHADAPGSHVVLRNPARLAEPDAEELAEAAALAAWYSKLRTSSKVEVHWTARRNVRHVPGGPPGAVLLRSHRSIAIDPALAQARFALESPL